MKFIKERWALAGITFSFPLPLPELVINRIPLPLLIFAVKAV